MGLARERHSVVSGAFRGRRGVYEIVQRIRSMCRGAASMARLARVIDGLY